MDESTTVLEYTPWEDWKAAEYLSEYYSEVMPDERFAMEWLVECAARLPQQEVPIALDFGCGPTVHHLFPLVPQVQEFHLAEYLEDNRAAVNEWIASTPNTHNWRPFSLETLELEGVSATDEAALSREQTTRQRITRVLPGDAGDENPLGIEKRRYYPLVTSHYCAEGATNDKETWRLYMRNIASLVAPGGTLILSACGVADFYCVGERRFPCAGVSGQDVLSCLLEDGFGNIDLRVRQVPGHAEQGYSSVIFACATRLA